jgi:LacI family transcriptional regulator
MPATLKDIARRCGLAVSTVSNILNNHQSSYASLRVKNLVRETADALGYRKDYLSLSLRTKRTRSIGLSVDFILNETRHQFIQSFVEVFNGRGYEVAIMVHQLDPGRAIDSLRSFETRYKDGAVLFTDFLRDIGPQREQLVELVGTTRMKLLGIGSELAGVVPCLDVERDWAFADCVRRLAHHVRVLVVYKAPGDFRNSFGLLASSRFVHMSGIHAFDDFRKAWPQVHRRHPDITAAFFRSDEVAIPALKHLAEQGVRAPDDLAVVSFDNFGFSQYTTPALTTYDIRLGELGGLAARRLLAWVEGGAGLAASFHRTIRPTFVRRESHARPRHREHA